MTGARTLLAAAGVATLLLAAALSRGDGGAAAALANLLGSDYLLVAAVGGLALALAVPVLASGRAANLRQLEMPTPEEPTAAVPAGSGFDAACERWALHAPFYGTEARERLRARLRTAAVETVRRRRDCDREAALARIRDGEWSDDEVAARFLAGGRTPPSVWLPALTAGEPPFGRAAKRTAVEIVRLNEAE